MFLVSDNENDRNSHYFRRLVENIQRLNEIERLAKIGSWELDLTSNTLYWSDEIYRIFGTDPQSFGATYEAFLNFIHPEDRKIINKAYILSVENKKSYGPITHRIITSENKIKYVEESGYTEYDESGVPIRSIGVVQDVTDRILAEKTKIELKEKEVLLKEIHHRVKNNLQLVSSLISIQQNQVEDEDVKFLFKTCKNRIETISMIHEQLYRFNDLERVRIINHVQELILNIRKSYENLKNVEISINVCDESIKTNAAIPCGLIINEIITNSFKHAFDDKGGVININIQKRKEKWLLQISDNGKGVKNIEELTSTNNLGLEIVQSLVEQLEGNLKMESAIGKGVTYTIIF